MGLGLIQPLREMSTRNLREVIGAQVNLALYGKGVYYMAVRIYIALPNTLKGISEDNSCYTLDEFLCDNILF
jgi:hypothetical protein